MKKNLFTSVEPKKILKFLLVAGIVIFAWFPVLFIPFINDDYQILGYNYGHSLISILKPFWTPDVSIYYWRPLGNIIHPVIMMLAGFHAFPFRLTSLLMYAICCWFVYYAGLKLNIGSKIAAAAAIIFFLLPSHELQVAWIAEQGETLLAVLLILSFLSYLASAEGKKKSVKYTVLFLFFLAASMLVKELAFVGVFIPFIVYVLRKDNSDIKFPGVVKHVAAAFGVLLIVLLYRYIVVGGTPFSSPNFSGSGPVVWIKNFFIYIPLAFFPPETLEFILYNLHNWAVVLSLCIVAAVFVYLVVNAYIRLNKEKKNSVLAGLMWYVVFAIPALPALMRWYVFTASIGLIWMLAGIFEYYWEKINRKQVIALVIVFLFAGLAVYNFSVMERWVVTGKKFESTLEGLKEIKNDIKTDSVFVWCVPDKYERISMMKLGVQQSVQWVLKNKTLEVMSPLRAELTGRSSTINFTQKSDSVFVFHLYGGRFLPVGGKSESIIENETIDFKNGNTSFKISTFIKGGEAQSIAVVKLKSSLSHLGQLYYNGNKFVMMAKN